MASQAWQLAGEIVRAALKLPLHERAAYLASACAGNDALRQEVETLLRYNAQPEMHSGSLLSSPSIRQPSGQGNRSPQPVHPLTQRPQPETPPEKSAESPASLVSFNTPTIRMEPPPPPAPIEPEPESGSVQHLALTSSPEPQTERPEPIELDDSGPIGWLARLTEEEPRLFQSPPSKAPETARPASSPAVPKRDESLPTTPTKKAGAQGSAFESLFKRVTLPPTPKPPAPPHQPSSPSSSSAQAAFPATEVVEKSFETEMIPPAAPLPPTEVFRPPSVSSPPSFETDIMMPSEPTPARVVPVMSGASARLDQSSTFTTGAKKLDGRMLGPYQLLYEIGRGGMGRVYLAEDTRLGRRVALKMLLRSSTRSPEKVRRFEQEARAASSLNHPNILTIHEIGQIKGVHYLATEYVEGLTLRQMIEKGRIKLSKVLDIGEQIADALAVAHDANIIHRDIKPENLMMRLDGYIKVLDFGIAKLLEKNTGAPFEIPTTQPFDTQPGAIIGTVDYMSPEQARGLRVDKRTDIFSLGIVLYEMVTGVRPFTGVTPTDIVAALLTREPIPVTQRLAGAPEALHRIIKRALAKEREQRYPSAHDFANDLKALRQDLELAARAELNTSGRPSAQARQTPIPSDAPSSRTTGQPVTSPRSVPPQQYSEAPSRPAQQPSVNRPHTGQPSQGRQPPPPPTGRPPQPPPPSARRPLSDPPPTRPPAQPAAQPRTRTSRPMTQPRPELLPAREVRHRIGFWPWFLFLCAAVGLGAGIWANYYRTPEVVGLAVMPFVATRLSGGSAPVTTEDEEALRQALIEGLHESLLQRLSPLPKLRVMARNTVRNLSKDTTVADIGKYLDVSNVLTGRIVTRGSSVTISVELFDTTKNEARWSQRYERTLSDLHTLPEVLVANVAQQLPFVLNDVQAARVERRETNKSEAFQQYLKGRYLWQQRQPETIKAGLQYLRNATELDANYARAHAGLAEAYATAPLYGVMPVAEALPLCRAAAAKALQLDAQLAEAYRVQGFVLHQYEWNFLAAEKAFQRALEINPNLAQGHQEYGSLLSCLGRHDEGLAQAQWAEILDPLSSATITNTAAAYYFAGRHQEALDSALRARDIGPNKPGVYKYIGLIYQQIKRPGDALEALVKALTLAPKENEIRAQLACAQAGGGNHAEALKQLEDLRALPEAQALSQYRLATIYAALGDKERAIVALTQAVANREPGVVWLKVDPQLSTLHEDQRFKELAKQIGLP